MRSKKRDQVTKGAKWLRKRPEWGLAERDQHNSREEGSNGRVAGRARIQRDDKGASSGQRERRAEHKERQGIKSGGEEQMEVEHS